MIKIRLKKERLKLENTLIDLEDDFFSQRKRIINMFERIIPISWDHTDLTISKSISLDSKTNLKIIIKTKNSKPDEALIGEDLVILNPAYDETLITYIFDNPHIKLKVTSKLQENILNKIYINPEYHKLCERIEGVHEDVLAIFKKP